jgi:polyisoprenoid-binding protein YceI
MMTGDLTIKGNTKTVTIPFTLQIDQGEGAVVGEAAINRRNFGIGPDGPISGMIVGDLVKIRLDLVATRLDN